MNEIIFLVIGLLLCYNFVVSAVEETQNQHGRLWFTCMAPMFSISWSALEAPRRTELTPSFLRHQARGTRHRAKLT